MSQMETLDEGLDRLQTHLRPIAACLEGAQAEKDKAVLAERERCAKIAESYSAEPIKNADPPEIVEHIICGGVIAERIREGK